MKRSKKQDNFQISITQELSAEKLLKISCEHLLELLGPTTIYAFLPNMFNDWSLAAYVNYNPGKNYDKESFEITGDIIANQLAPKIAEQTELKLFSSVKDAEDFFGIYIHSLGDQENIATCTGLINGEPLIVFLFARQAPFDPKMACVEKVITQVASQLAKCIKVEFRSNCHDQKTDSTEDGYDTVG